MGRVFLCIQFLCYAHAEKTVTQIYCVLLNYFVERDKFFLLCEISLLWYALCCVFFFSVHFLLCHK